MGFDCYALPKSLEIDGETYQINSDYRVILDICAVLADPDFSDSDRAIAVLVGFYPDYDTIPPSFHNQAINMCFDFIAGGERRDDNKKEPKLVDWEQDFRHMVAPINKVLGTEIRSLEYLHWWTFLSAYAEIGDCYFAQIVSIRRKLAKRKQLDKSDREFYRKNKDDIEFKNKYSEIEDETLKQWGAK